MTSTGRSHNRPVLTLFFTLGTLLLCQPARAQSEADDAQYSHVINEALVEFNEHRFEEARALFRQAHALRPSARTLRALGLVEFELRNYVVCIEYLSGALTSNEQPLSPALRERVTETLARAAAFSARVELQIEPHTAQLRVDDEAPHLQPDGSLVLGVGRHQLSASQAGYLPAHRNLDVLGGEQMRLELSLLPLATAAKEAPQPAAALRDSQATAASQSTSVLQRWWFWAAVSAVVVGAGAGIVAATLSSSPEQQGPLPGNLGQTRMLLRSVP